MIDDGMWQGAVQARHALQPDGLLLCTFLGGQTLHELRASLAEAEAAVTGGLSPRIAPMGEIRDLGGLLQRAGFALPVADGTPLTASYVNAFLYLRRQFSQRRESGRCHVRVYYADRVGTCRKPTAALAPRKRKNAAC